MAQIMEKAQKIVIIEGDASVGQNLVDILKRDQYSNVFLYKNGDEGLKGIYDTLPHLILLDISLPDIDGYTVLARKQAEPLLTKIPVFLLSMQGVAINMRNIPPNSVAEVIISLNTKSIDIVQKVNDYFGYGMSEVVSANTDKKLSQKKKILWVEDDRLIGNILEKKILSSGFDLTHVKDGEGAIQALKTLKPDVIVVDLILPGMNGFEILEAFRSIDNIKDVPRMVLSNLSKVTDIDKAKSLGASKYLVKASTSLEQVIVEIKDLCRARVIL